MTRDGVPLPCYCGKPSTGNSRYCCDSCRAKASHARNYVRKRKSVLWTGPLCACGLPGRYDGKCGNHNNERRRLKAQWRRVLKELQAHLTVEEAREWARLAIADKLVKQ